MPAEPPATQPQASDAHWRELIGQIGSDVGQVLSSALERVTVLATTGKIDRAGLRALREEIEQARRVGMIGQQLARFASGRIRQSPEQVQLTQMLRDVLVQRGREATAREIELRQALRPAEVVVDATLLHALLQALTDWGLEHARGAIDFRIDLRAWPQIARLSCQFSHTTTGAAVPETVAATRGDGASPLDSMAWRLVQQIAWTLGLGIERIDSQGRTSLALDFPHTIHQQIEGVTAVEVDQEFGVSDNSKPLAGNHILVLAARRDLRADLREATRHMGLVVDFVNSVEEAEEFCRDALPHGIVYESALAGDRFERLRTSLCGEMPSFVFIEIAEEGAGFELSPEGSNSAAMVGRDTVLQSLPSALIFELSRSM
ncbi:MAG TPA: hypothetical protein VLA16_02045 [Ideonella sp.]|nr:hypothetical protein [Ideonella sp.]